MRIIERYPDFVKFYEEMSSPQVKPEELVGMYSESIGDFVQYMIEE